MDKYCKDCVKCLYEELCDFLVTVDTEFIKPECPMDKGDKR